jgi:hypothetical protein
MSDDSSRTLAGNALGTAVREMAITLARRENLVADDGQIYCWHCNRLGALMPSLACKACLDAQRERMARDRETDAREHPETHRWRALVRTMTEESRLDRDAASDLLRRAHELPSATPVRREALTSAFDARFGAARQREPAWAGRKFRRAGGEAYDER